MILTLLLSAFGGCDSTHSESKKIGDKNYSCSCTETESTEPVCSGSGESSFCEYEKTYECKCREAVSYAPVERECWGIHCQ
jgi:hypothetical protein